MAKTVTVTLGDRKFDVPKLNIGQVEEVTDVFQDSQKHKIGFAVLRIAFARMQPPVDVTTLEAEPLEVAEAVKAILEFSGFRQPTSEGVSGENPQKPPGR